MVLLALIGRRGLPDGFSADPHSPHRHRPAVRVSGFAWPTGSFATVSSSPAWPESQLNRTGPLLAATALVRARRRVNVPRSPPSQWSPTPQVPDQRRAEPPWTPDETSARPAFVPTSTTVPDELAELLNGLRRLATRGKRRRRLGARGRHPRRSPASDGAGGEGFSALTAKRWQGPGPRGRLRSGVLRGRRAGHRRAVAIKCPRPRVCPATVNPTRAGLAAGGTSTLATSRAVTVR